MPARTRFALLLSAFLAIAAIAIGLSLVLALSCETGDGCLETAVAWVIGVPLIALGVAVLSGLAFGWPRAPGFTAQAACTVWACVSLMGAGGIGGASNLTGILLGVLAIVMGALSVWVPR